MATGTRWHPAQPLSVPSVTYVRTHLKTFTHGSLAVYASRGFMSHVANSVEYWTMTISLASSVFSLRIK